jgi:hypothetical protein
MVLYSVYTVIRCVSVSAKFSIIVFCDTFNICARLYEEEEI